MPIDQIEISSLIIHNSWDVRSWPATATITRMEFRSTGVHIDFTKNMGIGAWPNFRPAGWDGDLQFTLWIALNIAGQWHATGGIQFWQDCDQNGGPPEAFATNWYYAADRWAPMTGYQPKPGELVGFFVTAGDARNSGQQSVQERSNIIAVPFPSSGGVYLAPPTPVDPPMPPVDPPSPPVDPPIPPSLTPVTLDPVQYAAIMARFDNIDHALVQGRTDLGRAGADFIAQLPALLRKALTGR